jgi:peroxiredoxin
MPVPLIISEELVKSPASLIAVALLAATSLTTADADNRHMLPDPTPPSLNVGPATAEPAETLVAVGDPAPDFSYEAIDYQWKNLHDFLAQGSVLLVFAPTEDQMRELERERPALLDHQIIPVAVLDRRDGATWSTMKRLQLGYSLLADPQCVIASQFNACDAMTRRAVPSWFLVDRQGLVRGLKRERLPNSGYATLAMAALGLPNEGVAFPARSH